MGFLNGPNAHLWASEIWAIHTVPELGVHQESECRLSTNHQRRFKIHQKARRV